MTPDSQLLATFARTRSDAEFAELVRRHLNLVYSAALRQVGGDTQFAQDVAQMVFSDLARKAGSLAKRESLSGWLYTSAHFAAAKLVRAERRRREREEKFMREPAPDPASDIEWTRLGPSLDAAMHELKEADREAVLLRYFENRAFVEVGAKLGLSENAARMRVDRAVDKLRAAFARRGVVTTSALAAALSAHAVQVAPAGLASALTASSVAAAGAGAGALAFLKIMTATQIKIGVGTLMVAGVTTALVVQYQAQQKLRDANGLLAQQVAQLKSDNEGLSNQLAAAAAPKPASAAQLNELLKLRGEVGTLRKQATELTKLRAENQRRQTASRTAAATPPTEEEERQAKIEKMDNAKQGMLAFVMFADANQSFFPTNFAQASNYLKDDRQQRLENNFDIVYQGSLTAITNPAEAVVLQEKQAWQASNGKWFKTYAFADGHSEIHSEPNGDFSDWESRHVPLTAAGQ